MLGWTAALCFTSPIRIKPPAHMEKTNGFTRTSVLLIIIVGMLSFGGAGYWVKSYVEDQKDQIREMAEGENKQEQKPALTPTEVSEIKVVKPQQNVSTKTPIPSTPTHTPGTKQDSNLLIAQCGAKRDVDYNELVGQIDAILASTLSGTRSNVETRIRGYEATYNSCVVAAGESATKAQWCLDDLRTNTTLEKEYLEEVIEKLEMERKKSLPEAKQIVDQEYYQCISE